MFLDILSQFLATQFPDWGRCYLSFNPREKTLRLYCPTIQSRFAIAQDQGKLSALDIGIHKIVVIHDEQPDFIITMKPCVR